MHRWPVYLADLPATLLRLVAAANRISLPRRSTPAERLARVRQALCRPAAVRARYFSLPVEARAAAQELRRAPRCLSPEAVTARFGPLRPLAELRRDRTPRSLAEQLLLAGWLLPRQASRNHPLRYVVPPEVRAWLPTPIAADTRRETPVAATTLAVRGATAILLAAAAAPLPLRRDGRPTAAALRRLQLLLADIPRSELAALAAWAMPLLTRLNLLAPHGAAVAVAPAAARFLSTPASDRLHTLREAWALAPYPEPGLLPPRASRQRLNWPVLRRRLLGWAEACPAGASAEASFAALTAAFGPLADGFTHFAFPQQRAPWTQRTAAAVWARALQGPLAWLGLVHGSAETAPDSVSGDGQGLSVEPAMWRYAEAGTLHLPHEAATAELLALAPFAQELSGAAAGLTVRLSRASVARALGRGHDPARLRAALERWAGPLPKSWGELLAPAGRVRLLRRAVLLADEPAAVQGALRRRVVRRTIEAVVAPGIALAAPGRERALAEQLIRHGHVVAAMEPPAAPPRPPAELTQAEVAALLVASAHYRATAPVNAPPGPSDALIRRLRALLPPKLAAATDEVVAALTATPGRLPERGKPAEAPVVAEEPLAEVEMLWRLREAIRRREVVQIRYQGADDTAPRARTIRPLSLERHGDAWYVHAYCLLASAERCFRLDRMRGLAAAAGVPSTPARRPSPARRRRAPRVGIAARPSVPPRGSRLVGVWLEDDASVSPAGLDEIVGRVAGDLAAAVDDDALHGAGVEPVAAHAVGLGVDECLERAAEGEERGLVEVALEDAALHPGAIALEQLHHPGAPPGVDDVVADEYEHRVCRVEAESPAQASLGRSGGIAHIGGLLATHGPHEGLSLEQDDPA